MGGAVIFFGFIIFKRAAEVEKQARCDAKDAPTVASRDKLAKRWMHVGGGIADDMQWVCADAEL